LTCLADPAVLVRLVERGLSLHRAGISSDPLLPALSPPLASPSLMREILEDVPVKVSMFPRDLDHVISILHTYADACTRLALDDSRPGAGKLTEETKKMIMDQTAEAKRWARTQTDANVVLGRVREMKASCGLELRHKMEPVVRGVCERLARLSGDLSNQLRHRIQNEMKDWETSGVSPLMVSHRNDERVEFCINGWSTTISLGHLDKLKKLYTKWQRKDIEESQSEMNAKIACLLFRYQSFSGDEGTGLQSGIPPEVFQVLAKEFGVWMECFASPLNCYYARYCSAFPDTDLAFGSRGSFFDFHPVSGSFEVNPPFTEELLTDMAAHINYLLSASQLPMSFIVFISDWSDAEGFIMMKQSLFLRKDFVVGPKEHAYINGAQHALRWRERRSFLAIHATRVFILQNKAGFERWTPTEERIEKLRSAMLFS